MAKKSSAQEPAAIVPEVAPFKVAAVFVGATNGVALKRRFDRGQYPKSFLIWITPARVGVDLKALLNWLRSRRVEEPIQLASEEK